MGRVRIVVTANSPGVAMAAAGPGRSWAHGSEAHPHVAPSRLVGPTCIVASSLSLHSAAAMATTLFVAFGPAGTVGLRFLVGAALLLAIARPSVRGRSAGAWAAIVGLGVATAGASLCLFEAIARVPIGTAVTLQFLGPLAIAVIAARRRLDLAWAAMAIAGVVFITGGPAGGSLTGIALGFAAAACVAGTVVFAERVSADTPGLDGLSLSVAVTALVLLPFSLPAALHTLELQTLATVAAVGVLGVAVPYVLFFAALRRVGKKTYGVLLSLDPAVAAFVGLAFLGQSIGTAGLIGIGLVMAASAGVVSTQSSKRR